MRHAAGLELVQGIGTGGELGGFHLLHAFAQHLRRELGEQPGLVAEMMRRRAVADAGPARGLAQGEGVSALFLDNARAPRPAAPLSGRRGDRSAPQRFMLIIPSYYSAGRQRAGRYARGSGSLRRAAPVKDNRPGSPDARATWR